LCSSLPTDSKVRAGDWTCEIAQVFPSKTKTLQALQSIQRKQKTARRSRTLPMILISSPSGAANQELAAYSSVFEARTNRLYFSPLNICTAPPMSKQFKSGQSAHG
jgi:hypothetical protein